MQHAATREKNWRGAVRQAVAGAFALLLLVPATVRAEVQFKEHQVKARYLVNFTRYVEWPAKAFADDKAPFVIAILGTDPFGPFLDEQVKGETVGGRPIEVRRCKRPEEIKGCQMVFVAKSEKEKLRDILPVLRQAGVLTIGESDRFAHQGGIFNFYTANEKVLFEFNEAAAAKADLKVTGALKQKARAVQTAPGSWIPGRTAPELAETSGPSNRPGAK